MTPLLILQDADIFPDAVRLEKFSEDAKVRATVKVALFDDDGKIALVGTRYWLLPGGGVEEGETREEAVQRECLEEVGCAVQDIIEKAVTDEYRARRTKKDKRQITYFYTAKLKGKKGTPTTTQEDEQGIKVDWRPLGDALNLLRSEKESIPFESYNSCFNVRTHLAFLESLAAEII